MMTSMMVMMILVILKMELIAVEINRYAWQNNHPKWFDVSTDEVWIFLGIVILMEIHGLPQNKEHRQFAWCIGCATVNVP